MIDVVQVIFQSILLFQSTRNPEVMRYYSHMNQEKTLQAVKELRTHGVAMIPPEAVVGFRVGIWMDFDEYLRRGMTHPKSPSYYEQLDNISKADLVLVHVFESLKTSRQMDKPITVWVLEERDKVELMCIDGATRLSCVGILRAYDSTMFERVPAALLVCDKSEAMIEMVRRNVAASAGRPLDAGEFAEAVVRMRQAGWNDQEVRQRLGISPRMSKYLERCLKLHERGVASLKAAVRAKKIPFYSALKICGLCPARQEEIMASLGDESMARLPMAKVWESVPEDAKKPLALADAADAFRREAEQVLAAGGRLDPQAVATLAEIGKASSALRTALARMYL